MLKIRKVASPGRRTAVSPAVSEALAKQCTMSCTIVPRCLARVKQCSSSEPCEKTHSYQLKNWYSILCFLRKRKDTSYYIPNTPRQKVARYSMGVMFDLEQARFFQLERKVKSERVSNMQAYDPWQLLIFRVPAMKWKEKMGN